MSADLPIVACATGAVSADALLLAAVAAALGEASAASARVQVGFRVVGFLEFQSFRVQVGGMRDGAPRGGGRRHRARPAAPWVQDSGFMV